MKIRQGFISNSSSSSFWIGVCRGKKLTRNLLRTVIGQATGFMSQMEEELIDVLMNADLATEDDLEFVPDKLKTELWTVYVGSACNDSDNPMERYLCDNSLHVSAKDIKIIHEGGY